MPYANSAPSRSSRNLLSSLVRRANTSTASGATSWPAIAASTSRNVATYSCSFSAGSW